jgi:hypothetical protein
MDSFSNFGGDLKKNEEDVSDALRIFFGQFGTIDACAQLVLEEFFKELLNESVHLSGEPQKGRNQGT